VNRFEYVSPQSLEQAIGLLASAWGETEILAGGTDLLGRMKDYVSTPKRVVNIKELPRLHMIRRDGGGVRLGSLVTLEQITEASDIRQRYPALARAVEEAASPQIRNVATLGGNLCQRPRCWYFRNGMGLMPKTADGKSLVVEGDNRYHAILGNQGPAYFVTPSTIAPMLIAYGARLRLAGAGGEHEMALEDFFRIPQAEDEREHNLKPNEIVTEVYLPPADGKGAAHYEVRQKEAFDWPLATAAVVVETNAGLVRSARIVMGAVAPVPWVSEEAAQAIAGKAVDDQTAGAAGKAAVRKAQALSHNGYKITLASVAVKRALLLAAGREIPEFDSHRRGEAA
jgi:xanthine dehydrogenase YagS FAD-binding subunit